jgi:hypothetical protein
MPLRNIGPGGALIESNVPLPADSVHRLTFRVDRQDAAAEVRVRYVKPTISAEGELTYLIGVEFLNVQPALSGQVERWMAANGGDIAAEA